MVKYFPGKHVNIVKTLAHLFRELKTFIETWSQMVTKKLLIKNQQQCSLHSNKMIKSLMRKKEKRFLTSRVKSLAFKSLIKSNISSK